MLDLADPDENESQPPVIYLGTLTDPSRRPPAALVRLQQQWDREGPIRGELPVEVRQLETAEVLRRWATECPTVAGDAEPVSWS
jgi:hypothetical protein